MAIIGVSLLGNFWLSLILVPVFIGAIGMVVEYFLIRRLYGGNIDYPLLLTFGLSLIMIEFVRITFGTSDYPFDAPRLLQGTFSFFSLFSFPYYRLFVIVITSVIMILLWLFLEKTNIGLIIRGGTRDSEMVRVLGIDISKIWLVVFGMGTGLAGLAGVLAAPMRRGLPRDGDHDAGGMFCGGRTRRNGQPQRGPCQRIIVRAGRQLDLSLCP